MIQKSFTIDEVAKLERVHRDTVSQWITAGELREYSVSETSGRSRPRWRIVPAALEEFRKRRENIQSEDRPAATTQRRKIKLNKTYI